MRQTEELNVSKLDKTIITVGWEKCLNNFNYE